MRRCHVIKFVGVICEILLTRLLTEKYFCSSLIIADLLNNVATNHFSILSFVSFTLIFSCFVFFFKQTWHLNGSSLCVSTSYHFCKERKWERLSNGSIVASNIHQKKAVQKNYETPYQLYKRNANTFWLDVPHHRAMMKKKVHPKRKLTMPTPKKGCDTVAVVEKLIKEHKKKRKKRNVLTENQNTPANNPNFLSLVRDTCTTLKYHTSTM